MIETDSGNLSVKLGLNVVPLGDVNLDRRVDYRDLAIIVAKYCSARLDPGYSATADLNEDGLIDYADLAVVAAHYGES